MPEDKFIYQNVSEVKISQCALCKHKRRGKKCEAFETIPQEILDNEVDHRKPYPGDNGIRFELNEGVEESLIEQQFD